ncbi:hypothetical protein HHK36_020213 [Tetracentron sinense]|uniref:Uncharacterized protein n=1 Tax=Tetracentron sinense TaxID=13715 RepID=A0A834YYL0_TETSI|nr:hypothetical protein HHK36_020213 [Tetracentron sinense]
MVNCTGEGVPFAEAISDSEIEVLGGVTLLNDPSKLRNLVLTFDSAGNVTELPLLTVQVTSFKCGGFVLGIGMNHCMTDLKTLMEFINSWAEIALGFPLTILPSLDRSVLRARKPAKIELAHNEFEKNEKLFNSLSPHQEEQLLYRSFSFNPEKITQLKRIAMEDGVIKKCTNFTVLSAFLWRARTRALKIDPNQQLWMCGELSKNPLSFAVKLVQEAIELVTDDYIRSAIDYFEITRGKTTMENTLLISKWTRLPLYSANFSWGDPIRVGLATIKHNWALFVPDGKESKNTIVPLCLPVSAMKIFQEMMQFSSILKSSSQHVQKPKKQKTEPTSAATPTAAILISSAEMEEGYGGQGQHNSAVPKPNLASSLSFRGDNWASSHSMQDTRNSATDINISLPGA